MNENIKTLISAVSSGDITRAKKAAISILKNNTTKKDEYFCSYQLQKLESEPLLIELPANISSFATMEDVSQTFEINRYLCTKREDELFKAIYNANKVGEKLASKRIRHLNSTLLYGESGTGKTTFGRYVAYKLGIPFLYINFSYLISSYMGKTGQNLQSVFDFAKQQKCVFMLDEIDAIATARGQKDDVGELSRVVISLMQALDRLGNSIILLAATNRYDIIDDAVKRRFSLHHEITKLNKEERTEFCMKYLSDCGYEFDKNNIEKIINTADKQSDIENAIVDYIIVKEINSD